MLAAFWTGIGEQVAARSAAVLLSPALAFWAGGALAWIWRYGQPLSRTEGWAAVGEQWTALLQGMPAVAQGAVVAGLLLGVAVSGAVVRRLAAPTLRLLEGYWPAWLNPLRRRMVVPKGERLKAGRVRLRELAAKGLDALDPVELAEYQRLDQARYRTPRDPGLLLPTRLGNLLRAAELRPTRRYGLDAVLWWPRLWLVLPDLARQEITTARGVMDQLVQWWLWGALFTAWTVWAPWALPVGIVIAVAAYWQLLGAAGAYGDLVDACFDLYRSDLYDAVGQTPPADPGEERGWAQALTRSLWRGPSPAPATAAERPVAER